MFTKPEDHPLHLMANPQSIAFFGASDNPTSMGSNLLMSMQDIGYQGRIYPVHPKAASVMGLAAYGSVADLPEVPDLAVVVLPTRVVNLVLEECGRKGIRQVIVVSGGFREVGAQGPALEERLLEIAKDYDIRILGPNCLGVANPHHKVNTTFIPFSGKPGFIGMASQSGSIITQMFDYLSRFGIGFSTAFSVGNEANTDLVDAMEYLALCPNTRVIAMYIEGLKRGRAFVEAARKISPHKPIVAYYVGGSETGRKAGLSHTGSMAGPDRLYDGIFRQSGVIRAASLTELFDTCWLLGALPPTRGNRIAVQTHSGGPGAAAADVAGRAGLRLPDLSEATRRALSVHAPQTGSLSNPVDLTFTREMGALYKEIPEILLQDENMDMLLAYFLTPESVLRRQLLKNGITDSDTDRLAREMMETDCDNMAEVVRRSDKPVVGFTYRNLEDRSISGLIERGIPVFQGPERAVRAMAAFTRYHRSREKRMGRSS